MSDSLKTVVIHNVQSVADLRIRMRAYGELFAIPSEHVSCAISGRFISRQQQLLVTLYTFTDITQLHGMWVEIKGLELQPMGPFSVMFHSEE